MSFKEKILNSLKYLKLNAKYVITSFIVLLSFVIIVPAITFLASNLHDEYIRAVGDKVVIVKIIHDTPEERMEGGGTGFHVIAPSGKTYILTNAHVCEYQDSGKRIVEREDGTTFTVKILAVSHETDLCLLSGIPGVVGVKVASEYGSLTEAVYAVGHPLLLPLTVTSGKIIGEDNVTVLIDIIYGNRANINNGDSQQAYDNEEKRIAEEKNQCLNFGHSRRLQPLKFYGVTLGYYCLGTYPSILTTTMILPGNSGSPAINIWGHVIGVFYAGTEGINWGAMVPLNEVKNFLFKY